MLILNENNGDDFNEAVINEPGAPEGGEANEPVSTRDAIERAYEAQRAKVDGETAPKEGEDARARDRSGRFAPNEGQNKPAAPNAAQAPAQGQQQPGAEQPQAQPGQLAAQAPKSWSPEAKAAYGALPPHVQGAIAKREAEVDQGFRVLQNYRGLEQYQDTIDRANTTHADVMKRALDWEKGLYSDPIATVKHAIGLAAQARNLDPRAIMQALVNPNFRLPQPQAQPQQRQQPKIDVRAEVAQEFHRREINSTVEKFLADPENKYAETVADHMSALIQSGQASDLPTAYQMACWANPEIRAVLINQNSTASSATNAQRQAAATNQARAAGKAVRGAPARGATPGGATPNPKTTREAVQAAYEAAGGRA